MHTLLFVLLCLSDEDSKVSDDGFSVPDISSLSGDQVAGHKFQAEINQLMGLIVNSLYSNRDIFIRELVSNAADALDKIRYISLTEPSALGELPLDIRIRIDPENNLIHIRDTGIGMTQEELVNNLGSIAKSGTKDFVKKVQAGAEDLTQIGQFGVGFYSSYLVADKVTVTSKNNNDDQYIWESKMDESTAFSVAKDPRGNTLGRGTLVTLHIREDARDYLNSATLKELIQHYNQFLTFPIYVWESHEETVEAAPEEEKEEAEEAEKPADGIEEVEEDEEEEKPKEAEKKIVWDWVQVNSIQPLWTRKPSDVTDEEYEKFYGSLDKYNAKPLNWTHFRAEGDVEFTALLYVPTTPPPGSTDFANAASHVKLYVKRVFISDTFDQFLPDYLNFIRGVVDSDDLPLNVSREILQQNKILQTIQKKLVRKIIALLQDIMEDKERWSDFYENYHAFIKMGIIRDQNNKGRLSKLLRFHSAKSPEEMISLESYVENMKEGQEDIYFIGGENKESLLASPLIERLKKRGYDVLLFSNPMDEYVALHLGKFDGKYKLADVSKEGLKLDESDKEKQEEYKKEFEPLIDYLKETLKKQISNVEVSVRLSTSPCALVSASWGMSANLERIMKAQALADKNAMYNAGAKKVLEINPRHPIMKQLLVVVENDEQSASTEDIVKMLYDTAALSSGFTLEDPNSLSQRLHRLVANTLDIDPDFQIEEEEFPEEPKVEEKPVESDAEPVEEKVEEEREEL